jgi:hypothetical protein
MVLQHIKTYKYAYLWAIIATFLCGTNGQNIPSFSFSNLIGIDKLAHMLLFGTETFLIATATKNFILIKVVFK